VAGHGRGKGYAGELGHSQSAFFQAVVFEKAMVHGSAETSCEWAEDVLQPVLGTEA
jgi:hypothetical protein